MLTSRVSLWHGAPTLFINDRPDTGLMLYHNHVERGHEEIADFARAGIDLLTTGVGGTGCLRADGTLDTSGIDSRMELILAANPRALVLTRFGLYPPQWWAQQNPGEMMVHYDPYLDENVNAESSSPSFASKKWRGEMGAAMQQGIRYCEERWGDHFLGYHLGAGDCGEWSYAWRHYTQSDYGPAQEFAFREWLKQQSGAEATPSPAGEGERHWESPPGRHQRWVNPSLATIPRDWRRPAGGPCLLDPQRDALLIDYLTFHSEVVAEAIAHFARLAKEELRRLGREKIVAIFYGYHFPPPGQSSAFCNSGHHALSRVLASPDIDVLCAPYNYYAREAGGAYFSQLVAGSARVHGKLVYSEDDTVTHVVPPHPYRYHCPDRPTTVNVLLRNALGALRDGGTSWYMDWFGQNWYRDDQLMESIAATQRLARERLEFENDSLAQVAVFVSERTARYLWHDSALIDAWAIRPMAEIGHLGAPVDVYDVSDLGPLFSRPESDRYRLLIYLDALALTEAERAVVRAQAAARGRTLVWTYAPGLIAGERWTADTVSALTGIRCRIAPAGDDAIQPFFEVDDPAAQSIGPGVWQKLFAGHAAVWHAAPAISASRLRALASPAGVHLYSQEGDQVLAERELLAVHAATDGDRTIHLPTRATVVDAFSAEPVAERTTKFNCRLQRGQTAVWKLRAI